MRDGPVAAGGCPLCGGARGDGQLKIRKIGETTTYGIPLVAGVSVTKYQQGVIDGICSSCGWRVFRGRWLAWLLSFVPAAVAAVVAAKTDSGVFIGAALLLALFAFLGAFYSFVDGWVWGNGVVRRLGASAGDYKFPATIGHVLMRTVVVPFVSFLGFAIVMAMLEK